MIQEGLRVPIPLNDKAHAGHPAAHAFACTAALPRATRDGSAPHSFKLTMSRVSPKGLIVGHYEREGEIKMDDTALDSPSEREIARQERMKREG
jgi:hypothetical protein